MNRAFPATLYRTTKGLTFDGLTDWMAVFNAFATDTFIIRNNTPSSVSLWVKSTKFDASTAQVLIARWFPHPSLAINEGGWRIYLWDVGVAFQRRLVFQVCTHFLQGLWLHSNVDFPLNTWTHVAMTYDGSGNIAGLKMYWDGVLQATTTIWGTWTTSAINSSAYTHLLWGCHYTAWPVGGVVPTWPPLLAFWFEGPMDETALWRHELTAREVGLVYDCGYRISPKHIGLPTKPIDAHWRMGEVSDGPFVLNLGVSYDRYPVGKPQRNAFWNNFAAARVVEDFPP